MLLTALLYIVNTFGCISIIFAVFLAFSPTINTHITDCISFIKIGGKIMALTPHLFYHNHIKFSKTFKIYHCAKGVKLLSKSASK